MSVVRKSGRVGLLGLVAAAGLVLGGAGFQPETKPAAPAKPAGQPDVKAPASTEALPSVDKVLEKYVEATGGKAAWEKVKTMSMSMALDIPTVGVKGKTLIWVGENGKSLSEVEITNFAKMKQGSDGETYWASDDNQGPRILEDEEREFQVALTQLNNPMEWKKLFGKVEVKALENVGDKPSYKVEGVTAAGDLPMTMWFEKESGLFNKLFMKVKSPEGEVTVEALLSDYKEVSGIKFPHLTKRKYMGTIEATETVEKIEINPEIPAEKFELPAEIKELKAAAKKPEAEKPAAPTPPATPAPKPDKK